MGSPGKRKFVAKGFADDPLDCDQLAVYHIETLLDMQPFAVSAKKRCLRQKASLNLAKQLQHISTSCGNAFLPDMNWQDNRSACNFASLLLSHHRAITLREAHRRVQDVWSTTSSRTKAVFGYLRLNGLVPDSACSLIHIEPAKPISAPRRHGHVADPVWQGA